MLPVSNLYKLVIISSMGNKSGTEKGNKNADMSSIFKEYTPAFEKYKADSDYLSNF
jgi:hypothetical protein